MSKQTKKPLAIALSATFLAASVVPAISQADTNPFVTKSMTAGYNFGEQAEAKDAEGTCGEGKKGDEEGTCGEASGESE